MTCLHCKGSGHQPTHENDFTTRCPHCKDGQIEVRDLRLEATANAADVGADRYSK